MGLTVNYDLKLTGEKTLEEVTEKLEALRQKALDLPFQEVGELLVYTAEDVAAFNAYRETRREAKAHNNEARDLRGRRADLLAQFEADPDLERAEWYNRADFYQVDVPENAQWDDCPLGSAGATLWRKESYRRGGEKHNVGYHMDPMAVVMFTAWPGFGCESAEFGLCLYPETIEVGRSWERRTLKTGKKGWSMGAFCKTQYAASEQAGGMPNFLRCHLVLIRLLQEAKGLGILGSVHDEGDFWKTNDIKVLSENLGEYNELVAGMHKLLSGALPDGMHLAGEIAQYPNFEALAVSGIMKGRELDGLIKFLGDTKPEATPERLAA